MHHGGPRMSYRNPEPEAHCYDCPNTNGDCAEYTALNLGWIKMGLGNYDRGHCHWGHESIQKIATSKEEA